MWASYPNDYRAADVEPIVAAARSGESAAVVGLSGAGKSNLMGFIANRIQVPPVSFVFIDCNRLAQANSGSLFALVQSVLHPKRPASAPSEGLSAVEHAISTRLEQAPATILCLLFDRFDSFAPQDHGATYANLRALRDTFKYRLAYVFATRHELPANNELGELLHANTRWLGPLAVPDARWTIQRYAARKGLAWGSEIEDDLIALTRGYPSLLRAACEARAAGDGANIGSSEALLARIMEFWNDKPTTAELQKSGLQGLPLLMAHAPAEATPPATFDTNTLTGKEHALLKYFQANPNKVCEKDDIIRSVWSEDRAFVTGMRDDSVAQLVRRLREKIEQDPSNPKHIQTVPSRGYRFVP